MQTATSRGYVWLYTRSSTSFSASFHLYLTLCLSKDHNSAEVGGRGSTFLKNLLKWRKRNFATPAVSVSRKSIPISPWIVSAPQAARSNHLQLILMTHHNEKSSHKKVCSIENRKVSLQSEIPHGTVTHFNKMIIEIKVKLTMDCNEVISHFTNFGWEKTFIRIGSFVTISFRKVWTWMRAIF